MKELKNTELLQAVSVLQQRTLATEINKSHPWLLITSWWGCTSLNFIRATKRTSAPCSGGKRHQGSRASCHAKNQLQYCFKRGKGTSSMFLRRCTPLLTLPIFFFCCRPADSVIVSFFFSTAKRKEIFHHFCTDTNPPPSTQENNFIPFREQRHKRKF